jgi:hypothetical protein
MADPAASSGSRAHAHGRVSSVLREGKTVHISGVVEIIA